MGTTTNKIALKKPTPKVEKDWDVRWNENADVLDDAVLAANLSGAGSITILNDGNGNLTVSGADTSITFDGMVESLDGLILVPANEKTYTLEQSAKYGYSVDDITYLAASGTVTGTLAINSTEIIGLGNLEFNQVEATSTALSANSVLAGDTLTLTLSGNTGVDGSRDAAFTIQTTRA